MTQREREKHVETVQKQTRKNSRTCVISQKTTRQTISFKILYEDLSINEENSLAP